MTRPEVSMFIDGINWVLVESDDTRGDIYAHLHEEQETILLIVDAKTTDWQIQILIEKKFETKILTGWDLLICFLSSM